MTNRAKQDKLQNLYSQAGRSSKIQCPQTEQYEKVPAFFELISKARRANQWSVSKAAKQCGYSVQQWRNLESGAQRPPLNRLQDISEILGIDPLRAFQSWALTGLDHADSRKLARLIQQGMDPDSHGHDNAENSSRDCMRFATAVANLDRITREIVFQSMVETKELLRSYRNELVLSTSRGPIRTRTPDQQQHLWPVPGLTRITQSPLGQQKTGLGFFSTVLAIPPRTGIFHLGAAFNNGYGGIEFFALLEGNGIMIVQGDEKAPIEHSTIMQGTVGYYPSGTNHGFLNSGATQARLFMVVCPHPGETDERAFIEIDSDSLPSPDLPVTLARDLHDILDSI